ncbi:hypothetical protein OH76DRAFT_673060 [Lentinus brumalis]|uniref:Uncharacterized protein n=1 Tax=Lentinus brumalis TaxID=2498619 RepID=A0A371D786_9APHY|nr:hypothetical protein OH76DRAFT_673060 [Polyporus brumalis]
MTWTCADGRTCNFDFEWFAINRLRPRARYLIEDLSPPLVGCMRLLATAMERGPHAPKHDHARSLRTCHLGAVRHLAPRPQTQYRSRTQTSSDVVPVARQQPFNRETCNTHALLTGAPQTGNIPCLWILSHRLKSTDTMIDVWRPRQLNNLKVETGLLR